MNKYSKILILVFILAVAFNIKDLTSTASTVRPRCQYVEEPYQGLPYTVIENSLKENFDLIKDYVYEYKITIRNDGPKQSFTIDFILQTEHGEETKSLTKLLDQNQIQEFKVEFNTYPGEKVDGEYNIVPENPDFITKYRVKEIC